MLCPRSSNHSSVQLQPTVASSQPCHAIDERNTYAKVRCEPQPANVGHEEISSELINLTPEVCKIARHACQRDYIDGCCNGTHVLEEQRHPYQVKTELDRVECCSMLGHLNCSRVDRSCASGPGAMRGITHASISSWRNVSVVGKVMVVEDTYRSVHMGPKTLGGGRPGGCLSARYVCCVCLAEI